MEISSIWLTGLSSGHHKQGEAVEKTKLISESESCANQHGVLCIESMILKKPCNDVSYSLHPTSNCKTPRDPTSSQCCKSSICGESDSYVCYLKGVKDGHLFLLLLNVYSYVTQTNPPNPPPVSLLLSEPGGGNARQGLGFAPGELANNFFCSTRNWIEKSELSAWLWFPLKIWF